MASIVTFIGILVFFLVLIYQHWLNIGRNMQKAYNEMFTQGYLCSMTVYIFFLLLFLYIVLFITSEKSFDGSVLIEGGGWLVLASFLSYFISLVYTVYLTRTDDENLIDTSTIILQQLLFIVFIIRFIIFIW